MLGYPDDEPEPISYPPHSGWFPVETEDDRRDLEALEDLPF